MADVLGELEIRIRGKLDDLDRDFGAAKSKSLGHVDEITKHTEHKVGGVFKTLAGIGGALAGVGAVVGAGRFLGGALAEMEEAQKTGAQTKAVIESTGGAANVTAKHVESLATSLSNMTGIDDEAIQAGQNMLLTFTNVQNRVGKGNDIFDQATKVMLDMSVAMGQDAKQTAIQLGKALNDPVKGITALTRVGVTFTDEQKKQIEAMVKAGDVAGAQKLILAELSKEFGGSAKAQATATDKMRVAWANLQESAGMAIAPIVGGLATLGARVLPAVGNVVGKVTSQFGEAFTAMRKLGQWQAHGPFEKLGVATAEAVGGVRAFVAAFKAGDGDITSSGLPGFLEMLGYRFRLVVDTVRAHWPQIKAIIADALGTVRDVIVGWITFVSTIWANFGDQITAVVETSWKVIGQLIESALQIIRGVVQVVTGLIKGDWSMVWDGITAILGGAWDAIKALVSGGIELVKQILSVGWEIVTGIFTGAWDAIKGVVLAGVDAVVGWIADMPGRIGRAAAGMWDGIKNAFRSAINTIIGWWNGLQFGVPGFRIGPVSFGGFTLRLPDIPYLAHGGVALRGGLAVVGERGPEMVNLPTGASVVPLGSGYRGPTDRLGSLGGGDSGWGVMQVFHIAGSILAEREVEDISRRALDRVGRHNVSAGVKVRAGR